MRLVIQRTSAPAHVEVDGRITGKISAGYVVLCGITHGDSMEEANWLADKLLKLRLFPDEEGKFDRDIMETGGQLLVVSQFTLYGNCKKGRRPDFTQAAPPSEAQPLFDQFVKYLRAQGIGVETGVFGAMMHVHLVNDGPVTMILEKSSAS
jgi:D-tyrosyl-tRNA(Tyr) deacylase